MMIPTIMTAAALVFLADPVQQQDGGHEECLFRNDCLRHAYGDIRALSFGKCASRSAWREQFIHATPDERARMRKTRHRTMDDRIRQAYQLDEPQEQRVQKIIDDSYAVHNDAMGESFSEMVNLRRQMRERLREYGDEFQREKGGDEPTRPKLPPWREDPILSSIKERRRQIDHDFPFSWGALLDRIDKILPKEQAKRGRERLAEQYPHGFSADGARRIASSKQEQGDTKASGRWQAYSKSFVTRYDLTSGQTNAAKSILDEVSELAARINLMMQNEIARYSGDGDENSRKLVAEAFQFDLDELFDEFKDRLDALLTTSQSTR